MKPLATLIISFVLAGPVAFAHGGNEHVRGVVTASSANSITVQSATKGTRTLTLSAKTTFQQAGKAAHLTDLKVGDRIVDDVPEKSNDALEIQIGAAPAARTAASKPNTWNGEVTKQGASYVFVSNGKTYKLAGVDVSAHMGHPVVLTGVLQGDTIKVSAVAMGKR